MRVYAYVCLHVRMHTGTWSPSSLNKQIYDSQSQNLFSRMKGRGQLRNHNCRHHYSPAHSTNVHCLLYNVSLLRNHCINSGCMKKLLGVQLTSESLINHRWRTVSGGEKRPFKPAFCSFSCTTVAKHSSGSVSWLISEIYSWADSLQDP